MLFSLGNHTVAVNFWKKYIVPQLQTIVPGSKLPLFLNLEPDNNEEHMLFTYVVTYCVYVHWSMSHPNIDVRKIEYPTWISKP